MLGIMAVMARHRAALVADLYCGLCLPVFVGDDTGRAVFPFLVVRPVMLIVTVGVARGTVMLRD